MSPVIALVTLKCHQMLYTQDETAMRVTVLVHVKMLMYCTYLYMYTYDLPQLHQAVP